MPKPPRTTVVCLRGSPAGEAAAHHREGLTRRRPALEVGRPREGDARREVGADSDVRLKLVAQSEAQHEIRAHAPVVLKVSPYVNLFGCRAWVAAANCELRCAAAPRANLHGREATALEQ
jgi:hypothetical protein